LPSVLITGANRGIGLEFARQYAHDGWEVIATCRAPEAAGELKALNVQVAPLDVSDFAAIAALADALSGRPLDVLINNAGTYGGPQGFGEVNIPEWDYVLRVNAMGPLKMMEAFAPHLQAGQRRVVASVTSRMGSIDDNTSGGAYAYRSSKAALNAVNKSLSIDLRPRGITCVVLHPGWVRTAMGGAGALITPQQSVTGMRRIIDGATPSHSGRFFNYDGQEIPW
jgi:NAD(P)-dependent dehydrogenase (short-subunit alcohol dehydrogenase family)